MTYITLMAGGGSGTSHISMLWEIRWYDRSPCPSDAVRETFMEIAERRWGVRTLRRHQRWRADRSGRDLVLRRHRERRAAHIADGPSGGRGQGHPGDTEGGGLAQPCHGLHPLDKGVRDTPGEGRNGGGHGAPVEVREVPGGPPQVGRRSQDQDEGRGCGRSPGGGRPRVRGRPVVRRALCPAGRARSPRGMASEAQHTAGVRRQVPLRVAGKRQDAGAVRDIPRMVQRQQGGGVGDAR